MSPRVWSLLLACCLVPNVRGQEIHNELLTEFYPCETCTEGIPHDSEGEDHEEESFWDKRRGFADKHAPAGIMGDHVHEQGEFMFEYKYMNMYMDGNRFGTQRVSDQQAFIVGQSLGTNFAATPTQMTMEMHMVHLMYGVTDDITAYTMLMFPVVAMDHIRRTPFMPNCAGPNCSRIPCQIKRVLNFGLLRVFCRIVETFGEAEHEKAERSIERSDAFG